MNDNHITQKQFFEAITGKKFNELLKRADKSTNILKKHINQQLNTPLYSKTIIKKKDTYCDIIITYFDQTIEIGHFTLHCKMDDTNLNPIQRKQGRIHVKNIKSTCYTVKCNRRTLQDTNSTVTMSYAKWQYMNPKLKQCIDVTLSILNEYMDFNSELSLDIPMTNYILEIHPCIDIIISKFSGKYKTKIRYTQRASLQARKLQAKSQNTIQHM